MVAEDEHIDESLNGLYELESGADSFVECDEPAESGERKRVVVRLSELQYSDEITDAILEGLAGTRAVFRRGGQVVAVRGWNAAESPAAWRNASAPKVEVQGTNRIETLPTLAQREGSPVVRSIRGGALDHLVSKYVECQMFKKPQGRPGSAPKSGQWRRVDCPGRILAQIAGVGGDEKLPQLEGILQVPSLRPDGSVIVDPGYDEATGYYLASAMRLPLLKERPEIESAIRARKFLQDLFAPSDERVFGFPWKGGMAETVVPIALFLTLLARPALGCVPAFVIDASTPGSGKGKVIGVISILATGDEPARAGWPTNPEEQEKTLGAYAAMSPALIAWDNVRGMISNTHLENALTTPSYAFRVLGISEMLQLPFRSMATFTGNNLTLGGDMPRRCIVGRLEPATEHPDQIAEDRFRHPRIEAKARRERAKYVAAGLTILRAYMLAGCPDQGVQMGSFGEWSRIVAGALVWCGAGDVTAFTGKENAQEPEEWSALRTLLASWTRLGGERDGLSVSAALSRLYPADVVQSLRKGEAVSEAHRLEWANVMSAVQTLARTPDRAVPDARKLGLALRDAKARWWSDEGVERRLVQVIGPSGKPVEPTRWRIEERR